MKFEYERGKLLKKVTKNENEIYQYYYNANGQRYKKTHHTITTEYVYEEGKLLKELVLGTTAPLYEINYLYNKLKVFGFEYNGEVYVYEYDILGNIIGIYDNSSQIVAKYKYDAYGNHQILNSNGTINNDETFIGNINRIRYKGYYYDVETKLYWVSSRYYNPEWGRWLSPDSIDYLESNSINGLNLYAYCGNDPINYVELDGHMPKWLHGLAIGLAVVGAILVVGAITALTMGVGTTIMATTMAGAVIHGAAVGTLIGAGIGVVAGGIIGGATTNWSSEGILVGMGIGFGGGAIIGAVIGGSVGALQYTSAANSWAGGKDAMIDHFNRHGVDEGYKNVIQYTKSAKNIIKNGTYITQKNAYLISKTANQFFYVGVAHDSTLITTFFTKTLTKTAMTILGLI